jgi:probable HAF family extracellular repeat protein
MRLLALLLLAALAAPAPSAQPPSFEGLGHFPFGPSSSEANAVSPEGAAVAGTAASGFALFDAYVWLGGGLQSLPRPFGRSASLALGISGGGELIVGSASSTNFSEPVLWTREGGVIPLGFLDEGHRFGTARGITPDGRVVVGATGSAAGFEAFRWTEDGGMRGLGIPAGGSSQATAVSTSGAVVVGFHVESGRQEAFRWTEETGRQSLGVLPGGSFSRATAVSSDGAVVVGVSDNGAVEEAFVWTAGEGMMGLGALAAGGFSEAFGVSASGEVVVGRSESDRGLRAFIWTPRDGMRDLRDVLVAEQRLDLTGWALSEARAITPNGSVIVGVGQNPEGAREAWRAVLRPPPTLTVRDVNRFGSPSAPLQGITVRLMEAGSTVALTVTDERGRFGFDNPELDPNTRYDLELALAEAGLARRYADVRLGELVDLPLALPLTLTTRLSTELNRLTDTGPLVASYDVEPALALLREWNVPRAEAADTHAERDLAAARLLVAAEGVAEVYRETRPLAFESAKLTVNAVTTALAYKKAIEKVREAAAAKAAAEALAGRVAAREAQATLELLAKTVEYGTKNALDLVTSGAIAALPGWSGDLVRGVIEATIAGVSAPISGDGVGPAVLQSVVTSLATAVGARVVASGYVLATDDDLAAAVTETRFLNGGEVPPAFVATQERVAEVALRNDRVLSGSVALGETASGWDTIADLSLLVGRAAPVALLATIGAGLKVFNLGMIVGTTVFDYYTLYETAFTDTPVITRIPFQRARGEGAPPLAVVGPPAVGRVAELEGYAALVAALAARVEADDREGVLDAVEALLAEADGVDAALDAALLELTAAAELGAEELPEVQAAYLDVLSALSDMRGDQIGLYAATSGYLVPALLEGDATGEARAAGSAAADSVAALAPRVVAGLGAFAGALDEARAVTAGLTVQAWVGVAAHGLEGPTSRLAEVPADSALVLRARVVNAGTLPASGVSVRLAGLRSEPDLGAPVLHLPAVPEIALGALAPGEARDVSWDVVARDTSAVGGVSVATYVVETRAELGRGTVAFGEFSVVAARQTSAGGAVVATPLEISAYPNPARAGLIVRYGLPEAADVRLAVYDLLGRRVQLLEEGPRAAGSHVIHVGAHGLAPGAYVLRLAAQGGTASHRLVIVR